VTFVALDDETGRPVAVPPVIPETDAEQRRYSEAGVRRVARLDQKRQALNHEKQG
jgi:acyl-CoA hydrolase